MLGEFIAQVIFALVVMHIILGLVAYLILLERKTAAWIQDRLGPNRVGPQGLLQPIADGVKFIMKEEFIPGSADKALYILAPIAILTPALCSFAVIPWGGILAAGTKIALPNWIPGIGGWSWAFPTNWPAMVANPDIGVLFVLAMASLAVYGVVLGGWASGSKYSFLGGLRATAQMLSYEIPLALSLLAIALAAGTLKLEDITVTQAGYFTWTHGIVPKWNVFMHPVAFLIFVTCIFAEANRTPFDLAECESELVGGYHTEYSSMKFALFFLGEYSSMITGSAVAVVLFLGGWHLPWIDHVLPGGAQAEVAGWGGMLLKFVVLWAKVILFLFFYMWIRWTLPRFRFDQLMSLAWRGMIPMSLGAFLIAFAGVWFTQVGRGEGAAGIMNFLGNHVGFWYLGANLVFFGGVLWVLRLMPKSKANIRLIIPGSRYNQAWQAPALQNA